MAHDILKIRENHIWAKKVTVKIVNGGHFGKINSFREVKKEVN